MKKLVLAIAIVLVLGMTSFANPEANGLFQRGTTEETIYGARDGEEAPMLTPGLPGHGSGGNEPAPLGSGIAVLLGLGAAYMVGKRHKEE